jgi:hypothetical protein
MEIQVILCEKEGENRSLESFRNECLDLFLNDQTMSLEVDPSRLKSSQEKLRYIALEKLKEEGVLTSYKADTGTISYFLIKDIWDIKNNVDLSIGCLVNISDLYNIVMPSLMNDPSMFKQVSPLEVDASLIEALMSVLYFSMGLEQEISEDKENTFSLE